MKRITITANQVRVNDRLAGPDTEEMGPKVTDIEVWGYWPGSNRRSVEVYGEEPLAPPILTLDPSDRVQVWR